MVVDKKEFFLGVYCDWFVLLEWGCIELRYVLGYSYGMVYCVVRIVEVEYFEGDKILWIKESFVGG